MKAENWEKLNGWCFGEAEASLMGGGCNVSTSSTASGPPSPSKGKACQDRPYDGDDLMVPEFMRSRAYAVPSVPVSAYCGQAAGRVKRRQHEAERAHRRGVNATFWMIVVFVLFVVAVNLPEWIF